VLLWKREFSLLQYFEKTDANRNGQLDLDQNECNIDGMPSCVDAIASLVEDHWHVAKTELGVTEAMVNKVKRTHAGPPGKDEL
jgi:hypothetical protein